MTKPNCDWLKCHGEAHTNPHIDNCMVCAPYWEDMPVCPMCTNFKGSRYKLASPSGYCKKCKKFYAMAVPEEDE